MTLILLVRRSLPWWVFFYLLTLGISCGGELFALRDRLDFAIRFHLLALTTAFVSFGLLWRGERQKIHEQWIVSNPTASRPGFLEVLSTTIIFLLLTLSRFYQLNFLPSAWDTESCGHRHIAASWKLIIEQELGLQSQLSSGLSWTVLHHVFTRLDEPLQFDLDQRLLGVAVSLLCCWTVYFFARFLRGPFTAILALIVYGFGPLDLHWSRLPWMHHLPVAFGMLLAWASFAAFIKRTWTSFFVLAFLMVCTKFVYPSAKMVFLGPVLGMCGVLLWDRREWLGHRRKLVMVVVGLTIFLSAQSILYLLRFHEFRLVAPFVQIQPFNNDPSVLRTLNNLWGEMLKFFREIFYGPLVSSHYTVHATSEPRRAMPSISVVFISLAFAHLAFMIRRPTALICIGLIIGGLIPALLTGLEDRRISFVLAFLPLLAGLELVWFIDTQLRWGGRRLAQLTKALVIVPVGVCLWSYQTQAFFSNPAARPIQHWIVDHLRAEIRPDTLIVNMSRDHDCAAFYGIYDLLRDSGGQIAYVVGPELSSDLGIAIESPTALTRNWHYGHTALVNQVAIVQARQEWPRKLYVLTGNSNREDVKARLRTRYPEGKEIRIEAPSIPPLRATFFDTAPLGDG